MKNIFIITEINLCFIADTIQDVMDPEVGNKVIAINLGFTERNLLISRLRNIGISQTCIRFVQLEDNEMYAKGVNPFFQIMKEIEEDSDVYAFLGAEYSVSDVVVSSVCESVSNLIRNTYVRGIYYEEESIIGIHRMQELCRALGKAPIADPMQALEDLMK